MENDLSGREETVTGQEPLWEQAKMRELQSGRARGQKREIHISEAGSGGFVEALALGSEEVTIPTL